ncbi:MAG TPA: LysR substrate-binding domain-containing protein [Burkholderiaceae bacterium]|nr:LysR substrate-binding domain-containing protein [Burkholderiaceae bacterium]
MLINLRQIEVFRTIMLTRSMSGAAKALHVSQPAVSRMMSHTEQRLGLKLFERIKGRLYPTPEAEQLFVEVSAVYSSVQRVNQVSESLLDNRSGMLRIACSANLSQSLLPRTVKAFLKRYPEVRIVLQTQSPQALLQSLFAQQVELGVAYMPTSHPALAMELLYENRIVAVLPARHRLARRKSVQIDDLLDEPFIGYSSDLPLGQLVRQLYQHSPRMPQSTVEVEQVHVACGMVEAGVGIALADEQTMQGRSWHGLVTRPVVPDVPMPVHVFYPLYKPLSRAAQAFVGVLKTPLR